MQKNVGDLVTADHNVLSEEDESRNNHRYAVVGAHAGHAYDLQTKFENLTVTATVFCHYPTTSLKRDRSMGGDTGTRNGRTYHQAHVSSIKAKKGYTSIQERFLRCLPYRQSQFEIGWTEDDSARLDEIAAETTPTLLRRPNEHDAKTLGFSCSCLTVQDQTDP